MFRTVILNIVIAAMFAFPMRAQQCSNFTLSGNSVTTQCNVGIGTTAPETILSVAGSNADAAGAGGVRISGGTAGYGAGLTLVASPTFSGRSYSLVSANNQGLFGAVPAGSFNIVDSTAGVSRLTITSAGSVGIGTSAPVGMLSVSGSNTDAVGANGVRISGGAAGYGTGIDLVANGNFGGRTYALVSSNNQGLFSVPAGSFNVLDVTSSTPRLTLTSSGNLGVGTTAPAAKLHVAGDVQVTGSITGATVIGATYQDIAEWVPASTQMDPGTVVVLASDKVNHVEPSMRPYDTAVAGVVSSEPGIILGHASTGKIKIATTGRVLVHATAAERPILIGDILVTSDSPGAAMKSVPLESGGLKIHRPGTILGKALMPLASGEGDILVLLTLQ